MELSATRDTIPDASVSVGPSVLDKLRPIMSPTVEIEILFHNQSWANLYSLGPITLLIAIY